MSSDDPDAHEAAMSASAKTTALKFLIEPDLLIYQSPLLNSFHHLYGAGRRIVHNRRRAEPYAAQYRIV